MSRHHLPGCCRRASRPSGTREPVLTLPRPYASPAARLLCGFLAVVAGGFGVKVAVTGQLVTRGGEVQLLPLELAGVVGVLGTFALGGAWVAVADRTRPRVD